MQTWTPFYPELLGAMADLDCILVEDFSKIVAFSEVLVYKGKESLSNIGADDFAEWKVVPDEVLVYKGKESVSDIGANDFAEWKVVPETMLKAVTTLETVETKNRKKISEERQRPLAIKGHTKRDACPYITRKEPNTECVAEFITEDSCENGRGEWIKVQQTSKKSHTAELPLVIGVTANPYAKAVDGTDLKLTLNASQLCRTFQDRTHVIYLKPRTSLLTDHWKKTIFYVGGMGKRGNIVQVYPAMEYRFTPERITVSTNDVLCFAWSAGADRTKGCWIRTHYSKGERGCQNLKPEHGQCLGLENKVVVAEVETANAHELNLSLNTGCYKKKGREEKERLLNKKQLRVVRQNEEVMKNIFVWGCLMAILIEPCILDMYLHSPAGSNNRLNGNQDNVRNANRLFDSQNNGKAGYNVGDSLDKNPGDNIQEFRQLPQEYYMSGCDAKAKTEVDIMWTNQHGTGPDTDDMVETQVILQYMCQPYPQGKMATKDVNKEFEYHTIRNGQNLATQAFANNVRENAYTRKDRGLHEPANYYQAYYRRERNKGLFTADQQLKGNLPIYTRQNPAGTRRGFEVPEERDYYPYWGPNPWNDIAIMVSDKKTEQLMKEYVNSPEYGYKYLCVMPTTLTGNPNCPRDHYNVLAKKCVAKYITSEQCKKAGGTWTKFITNYIEKTAGVLSTCHNVGEMKLARGIPYEPHLISQGADQEEQFVLVHKPPEWKVPCFPTNTTQRCVIRIRYNITTSDAPREFTAKNNNEVKNNPKTKTTDNKSDLQIALNTAQLSRTFQDRSHVMILKPRSILPVKFQRSSIFYINGMGKRGNIVQAYPAMEYRFNPERLTVTTDDVVCFVWSGSNNNQNNAGEGTARTDRTNVCWIKEGCQSLKPAACSSFPLEVVDHVDKFDAAKLNLHLNKGCYTGGALQAQLNNAPASCNPPCFRITKPGQYCYMGTRNNNFSNRRHIGHITVTKAKASPE
ncbi:Protein DD3-3 [Stylophora pistillata]|uniref:Protein DD3-3 n=1 Tax=Stylophora pistillata TaxID=50429 RepID=A0A2B4SMY6_STYPI|nr:Protein DD3-3 [Stylophora pistillata]